MADDSEREVNNFPNDLVNITVNCPVCNNANRDARRACDNCNHTGTVTKTVPRGSVEIVEDVGLNCDKWAEVDFGLGPVQVRCTRMDEHEEHGCVVVFESGDEPDPTMN